MLRKRTAIRLEAVRVNALGTVRHLGRKLAIIDSDVEWTTLKVKKPFTVEIDETTDDRQPLTTVTISSLIWEDFDTRHPHAYRLTMLSGEKLLIGTERRPYATATLRTAMPSKPTDNHLTQLTIEYKTTDGVPALMVETT